MTVALALFSWQFFHPSVDLGRELGRTTMRIASPGKLPSAHPDPDRDKGFAGTVDDLSLRKQTLVFVVVRHYGANIARPGRQTCWGGRHP